MDVQQSMSTWAIVPLKPLNRSKSSEGGLAPFDVELIYFQKAEKFGWFGIKKSSFATPDLIMSRVIWSASTAFLLNRSQPRPRIAAAHARIWFEW